ncbi:MAG: TetR/AcrR family transcriptional regulator [Desulfobacteraceae bacterium]|nr:MAG: TetR/AcrR family transcriptional regulator [Desulfobacteraceae bacterium]
MKKDGKKTIHSNRVSENPPVPISMTGSAEERILTAAMTEFAANGFHGARMQAIADTAQVNKAMLHYYFRSKENLYHQIIRTGFQRIIGQVLEAWTGPGALETRIEKIVDTYLDNYRRNPDLIKMVLHETIEGGTRFKQAFKEMGGVDFLPGIASSQILTLGAQDLDMNPMEKLHFIISVVGMCLISFISPPLIEALLGLDLTDFDRFIEQRRSVIKTIVLAYIKSRPSTLQKG